MASNGSLLPTNEQTELRLTLFPPSGSLTSLLNKGLSFSDQSLHINQGFSDPLVNCLQLQRILQGIKCH